MSFTAPSCPGRRLGLLVGVESYPRLDPRERLHGAVNDVHALADVLESRFAFDLELLLEERADRRGLLDALGRLGDRAEPGDVVVVGFSGHGSQVRDVEGDEPDGLDETWLPYDAHRNGRDPCLDLTDDQLFSILAPLRSRGVFVTLIPDCCHSGHLHRSTTRERRVRPDLRPPPDQSRPATYRDLSLGPPVDSQVVLSACRDDQPAYEIRARLGDGGERRYGAWTRSLVEVLRSLDAPATAGEVFALACRELAIVEPRQWPQIVGARDRLLFGVETLRPRRSVRVAGIRGRTVELDAGAASSLGVGSRWGLYPPGVRHPDDAEPRARVEVVSVGPLSSRARPRDGSSLEGVAPLDRAFELEPSYGERRLAVTVDGAFPGARDLLAAVDGPSSIRPVGPGEPWDVRVRADGSLVDGDGLALPGSPPGDVPSILRRLEKRALFLHGLELDNRDPRSALENCLSLVLRSPDLSAESPVAPDDGIPTFFEGRPLGLELRQDSHRGLYVYLLDFGFLDDVTLMYPGAGGAEFLEPDQTLRLGVLEGEHVELFFPPGFPGDEAVGYLKAFACTRPTDFTWITTDTPSPSGLGASRAGWSGGLEGLLAMGRFSGPHHRADEDWTTATAPFRLRRGPGG